MQTVRASMPAVVAALALFLAACGSSTTNASDPEPLERGRPRSGGTLQYALFAETNSWFPAEGQWTPNSHLVASSVFDRLLEFDDELVPRPSLARAVTPDESHTTWRIDLRPDIAFHDGTPLDAVAVQQNLEAHRDAPLTGPLMEAVEDIATLDDHTVEVILDGPWVEFPRMLASQVGVMAAPAMFADPEGATHPIGTGPFRFEEWHIDQSLTVSRNDDYWNGPVYLDGIEFAVVADNQARQAAFETGQLDVVLEPDPLAVAEALEAEAAGHLQVFRPEVGEDAEGLFLLNQERPPLDDDRVRRALNLATDREALTETMSGGFFEPAVGPYPPDSPWYAETEADTFDPAEAERLVDEYESDTGEPVAFDIQIPPLPDATAAAELVAVQWEAVGVDTEIVTVDVSQHALRGVTGQYDVAHWLWFQNGHPDEEYVFLHSDGSPPEGEFGLNFARNRNPAIDAALDEARRTDDPDRQRELYADVQEELAADNAHVFLWHAHSAVVAHNDVADVDAWALPDGEPGAGLVQFTHQTRQIWLDR